MMQTKAVSDRVIIKQDAAVVETEGGIKIPVGHQEKPSQGVVQSVGPDVTELKAGDIAIYLKGKGVPLMIDGVEHVIMKYGDVLAKTIEVKEEKKDGGVSLTGIVTFFILIALLTNA